MHASTGTCLLEEIKRLPFMRNLHTQPQQPEGSEIVRLLVCEECAEDSLNFFLKLKLNFESKFLKVNFRVYTRMYYIA